MATSSTANAAATRIASPALPSTTWPSRGTDPVLLAMNAPRRISHPDRVDGCRSVACCKELFDEGLELFRIERLLQEAVRTGVVRRKMVAIGGEGRDDDHGCLLECRLGAQMLEHGQPAAAGHHHV